MKLFTPRLFSLAASALLATSSMAQCLSGDNVAPGGLDPLVGQWAFHWESESQNTLFNAAFFQIGISSLPAAAIGTFNVQRALGTNLLTVDGNMTVNVNGRLLRYASTGTRFRGPLAQYQCIPGTNIIQGGTLHLSDGSFDTMWQFVFKDNTFSEIFLVSEEFLNPGGGVDQVLKGNAVKFDSGIQTANCLAVANEMVTNPLTGLPTLFWSLQTQSVGPSTGTSFPAIPGVNINNGFGGTAAIGDLVFTTLNRPGLTGTVSTATSGFNGAATLSRLAFTAGSYGLNPCNNIALTPNSLGNGGNMSLMIGPLPMQYEYLFINNSLSMAYILSTSVSTSDILYGTLNRWN